MQEPPLHGNYIPPPLISPLQIYHYSRAYIRKIYGGDYICLILYVNDMLIALNSKVEIDRL